VQAEKDDKARIARELKELEDQKILLLARMELQEEEEEAKDRQNVVRHVDDSGDDADTRSEVFSFTEIDNEESEDSGNENVNGKKSTKPGPNVSKKAVCSRLSQKQYLMMLTDTGPHSLRRKPASIDMRLTPVDTAKEALRAQAAPSRKRKGAAANETHRCSSKLLEL